jgi:hypothetical protein
MIIDTNTTSRYYADSSAGNCICIPSPFTTQPYCPCIQSRLQCLGFTPMCRFSFGYSSAFSKWYNQFSISCKIIDGISLAHIPLFLYPFLNTTSKTRPFEYLRLTSLGVIGALVKVLTCSAGSRLILTFFVSKMITTLLFTSFFLPKSYLSAFALWRQVQSYRKLLPFSSSRKSCWTKLV